MNEIKLSGWHVATLTAVIRGRARSKRAILPKMLWWGDVFKLLPPGDPDLAVQIYLWELFYMDLIERRPSANGRTCLHHPTDRARRLLPQLINHVNRRKAVRPQALREWDE